MEDYTTLFYKTLGITLAISIGAVHRDYVSMLFEKDRHFSHLSEIEREMSFRTEMGMYYYYFKIIAEAPTFLKGLSKVFNDTLSQYPNQIQAQSTYDLLPEMTAGFLYHNAKLFGLMEPPECWQIKRGEGLSTVISCQGLAVPSYFYLEFVWIFAGMTASILFLYAKYLSGTIFGGFLATLLFFLNHTECTRVQWTPPLRESFAYPILLLQMYNVTVALDKYKSYDNNTKTVFKWRDIFSQLPKEILTPSFLSIVCWQFTQFVFMTQIIALHILQWLNIIPRIFTLQVTVIHMMCIIYNGVAVNQDCCFFYLLIISIHFWDYMNDRYENFFSPKMLMLIKISSIFNLIYLRKFILSMTTDDYSHVFNIIKTKFTNYKDFHTLLYTCSPEFDFLPYDSYEAIVKTLLLPTSILAGFMILYFWYRNYKTINYPKCIEASVAYNLLQTGAFIIMALTIMRLKLFMNPHLCIISGLTVSKRYIEKLGIKKEHVQKSLIFTLIIVIFFNGHQRISDEVSVYGEYSNVQQEELFEWIKSYTPENAVFAGKMSIMANLLLSTRRPIVNNPYYESREMRDKTMKVYEMYSRKDPAAYYETLRNLHVDYLVLEEGLCYGLATRKPGCRMIDLWDVTDGGRAKRLGKRPLCPILFNGNAHPFRRVFANSNYVVLRLDYSTYVELKPSTPLLLRSR